MRRGTLKGAACLRFGDKCRFVLFSEDLEVYCVSMNGGAFVSIVTCMAVVAFAMAERLDSERSRCFLFKAGATYVIKGSGEFLRYCHWLMAAATIAFEFYLRTALFGDSGFALEY